MQRQRCGAAMHDLPAGTVTFIFTDIDGSTRLLDQLGDEYAKLLADQRSLFREIFSQHEGQEVDTQGDSFFYSFPRASQAVNAAVEAQRAIKSHAWPQGVELRVRMGLHTGEPLAQDEGYVGMDVHRAERIASAGHGGQILLSETTTPLIMDALPEGTTLVELGRHRLKDMRRPERITQVVFDGMPEQFPPLKSLEALPPDRSEEIGSSAEPEFLKTETPHTKLPFIGRAKELERLQDMFERTLEGEGGIGLITGGPGRGKTALLETFSHQITSEHPNLFLAWGACSARAGQGDPYHPFRQVLRTFTGDLKTQWLTGKSSSENTEHLWHSIPIVARAISQVSPQVIGRLVSGQDLLTRVRSIVRGGSAWIERLAALVEQDRERDGGFDQSGLFEQFGDLLGELASQNPMLIIIDDMQWIDDASVDLLFHLSRHLAGKRILLLGAYRPEEIVLEQDRESHPLHAILPEFKRYFGEIEVDLSRLLPEENRHFIDDLIDSEPNRLDEAFRAALFDHTEGHPLFTIELLRSMQERGDLVRDDKGCWVQIERMDWSAMPARVEGVIQERFGRLSPSLRELLQIASIQGEAFSAEVLSRILEVNDRDLFRALGQELDRKHRLVRELGSMERDGAKLSSFAFRHVLIQDFVYHSLGEGERKAYHAEVGHALEAIYGPRAEQIAAELAQHFTLGGVQDKALRYLLESGDQARIAYAFPEALRSYRQALEILEGSGQAERTARTLLKIGLIHNAQGDYEGANRIYEQAFVLWEPIRAKWESERDAREGKRIRIAAAEPRSLDPALTSDDASTFITVQLYEGLVTVDEENNVLPAAAERWQILEGGKRYRFHLRQGLKWSDGSDLTAGDFVRTWKRNLRIADRAPMADLLFVIKNAKPFSLGELKGDRELGVRAENHHTLEVELEDPIAYLPHLLTHPITFPLPGSLDTEADVQFRKAPDIVSNGPFRIIQFAPGESLTLERNPYYGGPYPGNVRRVECLILDDYREAFNLFDEHKLDLVSMITSDPETVRHAYQRYGRELLFIPQPTTFFLTFCCQKKPFDDVRVRQAFVHAVDRQTLISEESKGQYAPALGGFLPPGLPGHQPDVGLSYDPELARHLLIDAGFSERNRFPGVELLFAGPDPHNPLIDNLRASWRDNLGVRVEANSTSWKEFMRRRDEDPPELSTMGFTADYPDPDGMLRTLFHSEQGFNPSRYANETVNGLLEQAARTLGPAERIGIYQQIDRLLIRMETVVMPIGYTRSRVIAHKDVSIPGMPAGRLQMKKVRIEPINDDRLGGI